MPPEERNQQSTWRQMHSDTAPWAERLQLAFFRDAPAWKKLEVAGDLLRGALDLVAAELERQHPYATTAEIRRRLADRVLGVDLAAQVYGPVAAETAEDGS